MTTAEVSEAVLSRLDKFAATKELGTFTDLEVRDLLEAYRALRTESKRLKSELESALQTIDSMYDDSWPDTDDDD